MVSKNGNRPSKRAQTAAADLLETTWGLNPTIEETGDWAEELWSLATSYLSYLEDVENEKEDRSDASTKMPSLKVRQGILEKIATASTELLAALHTAKAVHPKFFARHLPFPSNGIDGGLLVDMETGDLDSAPFIDALKSLAHIAETEADFHSIAGSSPSYVNFRHSHPTIRLICDCLECMEMKGISDQWEKLHGLASAVVNLADSGMADPPLWDDYAPRVKEWW